jgi:hypothetical protein
VPIALASHEVLAHEHTGRAGRISRDFAEHAPAVALVEARGPEADGVQHGRSTSAAAALVLGDLQDLASETGTAVSERQVEQVDEQQPQRRATEKAAHHPVRRGVPDEDGERSGIVRPRRFRVERIEPVRDQRDIVRGGSVGDDDEQEPLELSRIPAILDIVRPRELPMGERTDRA